MHDLAEPWAKTNEQGETRSVIEHCLDVSETVRAILAQPVEWRRLSSAFGVELNEAHLARLAVLTGLHDFGKCLKGFQDKLDQPNAPNAGHVAEALAVLGATKPTHAALGVDLLRDWFDDPTTAVYVSVCHHGEPVSDARIRERLAAVPQLLETTRYGHDPATEMCRLREALIAAFPQATDEAPKLLFPPAAQHLFTGILMTADWMASGFAFNEGERHALAEKLLDDTGWSGWHSGAPATTVLGSWKPNAAQAALAETSLDRLIVVEAPTGSGKTEAALIWANRLVEQGVVDGFYFAVPTRSAATELHARIGQLMAAQHPLLAGKVVRAVPGMLDLDDARPNYPPETWAVAAPKRVFAAPVAVGTIDQALLSIVRSRHAWLRAALIARHLLIIDEVHASDPYMATLTNALVQRHLRLGGYVLAMSATLGESMLAQLQGRPRKPFEKAERIPYPAVRTTEGDAALEATQQRCIALDLIRHDKALGTAVDAARDGQAILLIRSTVNDAIADYLAVSQQVEAILHHSRFALEDRTWLDQQLMAALGPQGQRRGLIAVTTQTAEQSLDIDADLLITDACPADVLLQRLGRLHRHRHGTKPQASLIDPGPLDVFVTEDGKARGRDGQGWPWVYENVLSVSETLDWVRARGEIIVPDHCRALVERATHADHLRDVATQLGSKWQALWRRLYESARTDQQLAEAGLVDWNRPYRDALVDDIYATRLGDGSVTVVTPGLQSPFTGEPITAMPIPANWLRETDVAELATAVVDGREIRVAGHRLSYSTLGLQRPQGGSA